MIVSTLPTLIFNIEVSSFTIMRLLSRISTLGRSILDGMIDIHGQRLCGVFSTLSLSLSSQSEGFKPFEHSSSGETCFSKLCFEPLKIIIDGWTPSAVRNLIIMRCSKLTDTFCSLIPLVELRQDWTSSQLPEREGREATSLFQGQ